MNSPLCVSVVADKLNWLAGYGCAIRSPAETPTSWMLCPVSRSLRIRTPGIEFQQLLL